MITTQNHLTIAKAQAAREMGVSDGTIAKMQKLNLTQLRFDDRGRPYQEDVEVLAAQRARLELRPDASRNERKVFACPTTSVELGGHLRLQNQHDAIHVAHKLLEEAGLSEELTGDRYLTGAWEITHDNATRLEAGGGYLLGVVGGYVLEAARVISFLGEVPYRKRKLFLVEPVTDEATLLRLKGFVPGMSQTPIQVRADI